MISVIMAILITGCKDDIVDCSKNPCDGAVCSDKEAVCL